MDKSDVILEIIELVERKTKPAELSDNASHEETLVHYATENGAKSALLVMKSYLIDELEREVRQDMKQKIKGA